MKTTHSISSIEILEPRIAPALAASLNLAHLNGANGFSFSSGDIGVSSVSDAGDVNGDGFADLIVGASTGGLFANDNAYVIFGKSNGFPQNLRPSMLNGANGFKISGKINNGAKVASVGDLNADGFDDVVVQGLDPDQAYVILGRASFPAILNVAKLNGANGFQLLGNLVSPISGAGDVNGDGFDDLVTQVGVIFGRASGFPKTMNPHSVDGGDGFTFSFSLNCGAGGIGDVNEDGIDDLLIDNFVHFGHRAPFAASLDFYQVDGSNGFMLTDASGLSLDAIVGAKAGDVNGDGMGDFIVTQLYGGGRGSEVIFGRATPFPANFDIATINGSNGFTVAFEPIPTFADDRHFADGDGDVNGDGLDDVLLGFGTFSAVIYGKHGGFPTQFDASSLDAKDGFSITKSSSNFVVSVSRAGDVNHDGFGDVIVVSDGKANVIFGSSGGVKITKNGRTATFTDVRGDSVTIHVSKGRLSADDFILSNPDLGGAQLQLIDFAGQTKLNGADVTITAHRGPSGGMGL